MAEAAATDWYPDPLGVSDFRYWDGTAWTQWVCVRGGEARFDQPPPPPAWPIAAVYETIPPPPTVEAIVGPVLSKNKLKVIDRDAKKMAAGLKAQHRYLAELTQHAPRDLRHEFGAHVDSERQRILQQMPVEQLKDFDGKVRVDPLVQEGLNMAALLGMGEADFALIPGVGPVGAAAIRHAAIGAMKWADEYEVRMPRPDQIRPDQIRLLRTAARQLRARQVPDGLVPELETTVGALEAEQASLKKMRSRVRRFVRRGGSEDEIQLAARTMSEQFATPSFRSLVERSQVAVDATIIPNFFDELLDEYGERFADYGSILDDVVNELGGAGDAMVEKARGGLPAQVAARIESLELHLAGLDVHLRGYQEFGTQFMISQNRVILGDEMGLGKTIQALAAITHVANVEAASRFMVVAPASLLANWEREVEARTDLNTHIIQGPNRDRHMANWLKSGGIAITSFSSLIRVRRLDEMAVDYLVVDEAHYVKNPESKRSKAVAKLSQNAERMVLMSGTPLENRVEEFKNLVRVTDPPFFHGLDGSQMASKHAFRSAVAPLYLRRNQEDVLKELPQRLELEEWVDLGAVEKRAHREAVSGRNMMGMRQAAIFGDGPTSAKLERLEDILTTYEADGQKVIVFSYFLGALDAVQSIVPRSFRIDGSLSASGKLAEADQFGAVAGHAVLVSQITAGGVGLNLHAASVVVLMEPQFKPTTEWQAIARAHRMGQARRVTVHRILARNCVDESLYELVGVKAKIFDDFARESLLKEATSASIDRGDDGIMNRIFELEAERELVSVGD